MEEVMMTMTLHKNKQAKKITFAVNQACNGGADQQQKTSNYLQSCRHMSYVWVTSCTTTVKV